MTYELIKDYYLKGLFTDSDLALLVQAGFITQEQATEIIASKTL